MATPRNETQVDTAPLREMLMQTPIAALKPKSPIAVGPAATLADAILLMNENRIGCVLVVADNGRLVGIFTERDVLTRVAGQVANLNTALVSEYMTPNPVTAQAQQPIAHALQILSDHTFRHLPLVDANGQLEGIISFRDVVTFLEGKLA